MSRLIRPDREAILKAVWEDEGNYIGRTSMSSFKLRKKKLKPTRNVKNRQYSGIGYKLIVNDGVKSKLK
jgi:hypothetical protein